MSSLLKLQIVFGLLVLCIHQNKSIKFFSKPSRVNSLNQRQLSPPSTSQTMNLHQQRPLRFSESSSNSMGSINLNTPLSSSSLSGVYRSISSPSLNVANSQAVMRETPNLHRQAASVLNSRGFNIRPPVQRNNMIHRLTPNLETLKLTAKYIKNGAIIAGGSGGIISMANLFSNNNEEKEKEKGKEKNVSENTLPMSTTTTTTVPEISNPIGIDK